MPRIPVWSKPSTPRRITCSEAGAPPDEAPQNPRPAGSLGRVDPVGKRTVRRDQRKRPMVRQARRAQRSSDRRSLRHTHARSKRSSQTASRSSARQGSCSRRNLLPGLTVHAGPRGLGHERDSRTLRSLPRRETGSQRRAAHHRLAKRARQTVASRTARSESRPMVLPPTVR